MSTISLDVLAAEQRSRRVPPKPTVLDCDAEELAALLAGRGEAAYRGRQLFAAIHQRAIADWEQASELPARLRAELAEAYRLTPSELVVEAASGDGTRKRLLRLWDGQEIETVAIPSTSPRGHRRVSVCVSTQAGCAMACTFCATGMMGLARNLTPGEIVDQVYTFARAAGTESERARERGSESGEVSRPYAPSPSLALSLSRSGPAGRPTHVVFMGMGEPLANYEATVKAVRLLTDPRGMNIGQRRITVSTSGLVPGIERLAEEELEITLAISLHAPNDELRDRLMPINRRWPLEELISAAAHYAERTGRRVSYEYVLLRDVNDGPQQADELIRLLPGRLSHVNLIPYNATGAEFAPSPPVRARAFAARLREAGLSATIRASRGRDIAAACGQLRVENRKRQGFEG